MGNRMSVQIKHEIKFGASGFNWQMDGVEALLKEAGCYICGSLNEEAVGDWEIDDKEFLEAIKKIKEMQAENIASHFDKDYAGNAEECKTRVVELLQKFADTGDHHDGYYHFSWF